MPLLMALGTYTYIPTMKMIIRNPTCAWFRKQGNKINYLVTLLGKLTDLALAIKVAVNRKLQKFMHGLSTSVLYIQVYTVRFPIIDCRASLVLTITANFIAILCSYARI